MLELLLRFGWAFPLVTTLLGALTFLAWSRRRRPVAPTWKTTEPLPGLVVLDGTLSSSLRLPGGHVVAADGTSAGQCSLVLADGRRVPLRGRVLPRARIPVGDDEPATRTALRSGVAVRVRGLLVPTELTADDAAGYREVSRSLELAPPDDEGALELAAQQPPSGVWVLGAVLGVAIGLFAPGLGFAFDAEALGLASPIFRREAATALVPQLEAALTSGRGDAVSQVDAYVQARALRGFDACPPELPHGAALEVVSRLGEVCGRSAWLSLALVRGWPGYGPLATLEGLKIAHAQGNPVAELALVEARLRVAVGDEDATLLEQLPEPARAAHLDHDVLERFAAADPALVDATLAQPFELSRWAFRLAALASARCGTPEARPICEKAFEDADLLVGPRPDSELALHRDLVRFGPLFADVHRRVQAGPLDPRVERSLLDRATAFRMLVSPPSPALEDEVRGAALRVASLTAAIAADVPSETKMRCFTARGRRLCRPATYPDEFRSALPRIATWLQHEGLVTATTPAASPGAERRRIPDDALDESLPEVLPWRELGVKPPQALCAAPEVLPTGADFVAMLHTRRRYRAICNASAVHDRWIDLWSQAYLHPTRGPRLARLEAALAGLEPLLPERTMPPPPEDTETLEVVDPKLEPPPPDPTTSERGFECRLPAVPR